MLKRKGRRKNFGVFLKWQIVNKRPQILDCTRVNINRDMIGTFFVVVGTVAFNIVAVGNITLNLVIVGSLASDIVVVSTLGLNIVVVGDIPLSTVVVKVSCNSTTHSVFC